MGWIDYVAPQLYFEFGHRAAPYEALLDWWNKHTYGKHCYVGLGIYKAGSNAAWKDKTLLPRQIEELRKAANVQGMIFFSSKNFINNPYGWSDSLRLKYFKDPAAIPEMDWMQAVRHWGAVKRVPMAIGTSIVSGESAVGIPKTIGRQSR